MKELRWLNKLLYEHSTGQVSLRKTLNRFKGRREEDTQRILEVKVSGRESALLDSTGPFTLSLRERTLFWRFLAKRALLIFHNAASLRLATLVLTAVIALQKESDVIFFNGHNELEITQLCIFSGLKYVFRGHMNHSWWVIEKNHHYCLSGLLPVSLLTQTIRLHCLKFL